MLVLTTSQVAAMSEGSVPEAMRGTIKKVWGRTETNKNPQYLKEGDNPKGSLQKLIVTDGTTDLQVMIDDRDAFPASIVGSSIFVMAFKGDRGLAGLKRRSNEYPKGTINPQLWVNRSADVVIEGAGGSGGASHQPAQQQNHQPPRQQTQAPARTQTNGNTNGGTNGHANGAHSPANSSANTNGSGRPGPTPADRANAIREYNRALAKASSAYERCFDAAVEMSKRLDARYGYKPDAATLEKMAACLMVQSCWGAKPSSIEAFPMRDFSAYDKEGVPIPTQAEEQKANGGRAHPQGAPFAS